MLPILGADAVLTGRSLECGTHMSVDVVLAGENEDGGVLGHAPGAVGGRKHPGRRDEHAATDVLGLVVCALDLHGHLVGELVLRGRLSTCDLWVDARLRAEGRV